MNTTAYVIATGARTPLGLRAAPSAAAYRAAISAMREHPFMIDQSGDPMPGALDSLLDPGLMGPERLVRLAETALREASEPLGAVLETCPRLPVYLGLPELRPGFTLQDAEVIKTELTKFKELPIDISETNIFTQGHAAVFLALATAIEQMRLGRFETCLVGGVDSYFQPDTMEWLDANRQLAGAVSRSSFVPGEGAGFCLLATERGCIQMELKASARVLSVATGRETKLIKTSDICFGEGLTATVRKAVGNLPASAGKINSIICDINGERYRGEEWGFVCLRLSQYLDDPTSYKCPANCWGDVGAASAPLFAMLACQAAARGYAKGPLSLLWASSEGGLRGAAVIETLNVM